MDDPGSPDGARGVPPGAPVASGRAEPVDARGRAPCGRRLRGCGDPLSAGRRLRRSGDHGRGPAGSWRGPLPSRRRGRRGRRPGRPSIQLGETPSTYPAWRNIAAARVRSGDLRGAIAAYREADRRAPPRPTRPRSPIGWAGWPRRPATRARRAATSRRAAATARCISVTTIAHRRDVIVSLTAPARGEGAVPLTRSPARQAGRRGRRVLAPLDRHAAPRRPAAPVLQHVRAVPGRADRRALVRLAPVPGLLPACAARAPSRASSSVATRRRSGRPARSSGCSACCWPRTGSTIPVDRASRGLVSQLGFLICSTRVRICLRRASTTRPTSAACSPGCGSAR